MGHFLIVEFHHGLFDILLGFHQFPAHADPVALVAEFKKALAPLGKTLADSQSAGLPDEFASDVLHILRTLGDRQHESIRHERAEVQCCLKAVAETRLAIGGIDGLERHRTKGFQILEQRGD